MQSSQFNRMKTGQSFCRPRESQSRWTFLYQKQVECTENRFEKSFFNQIFED